MSQKLNVLLLVDLAAPTAPETFEEVFKDPEWETERDVYEAIKSLEHDCRIVGLFNDVTPLLKSVQENKPDIVFNLVEHFNNNTAFERDVAAFLEMLGLPYTGSGPTGLTLCKNKVLMKKLMAYHKIKTPHFAVLDRNKPFSLPKQLKYPLFVKPGKEDASYGISQASFVESDSALQERVKYLHESMGQNALVEEYVEGRELYIGILGNDRLNIFSPRELVFREVPQDEPKIATYKAKWDMEYRKKWGIQNRFANPIAEGVIENINNLSKKVYRILNIQGYGRIDLRLTPENDIMILEANPNPGIMKEEELPMAADKDGIPYKQFIQRILQLGLQYHAATAK